LVKGIRKLLAFDDSMVEIKQVNKLKSEGKKLENHNNLKDSFSIEEI